MLLQVLLFVRTRQWQTLSYRYLSLLRQDGLVMMYLILQSCVTSILKKVSWLWLRGVELMVMMMLVMLVRVRVAVRGSREG